MPVMLAISSGASLLRLAGGRLRRWTPRRQFAERQIRHDALSGAEPPS